jgi:23S rRNA pseudouridine2605 synthase
MANFKDKNNKGGGKGKSTSLGQRKNYRNSYEQKEEGGYFGNPHDKTKRRVKSTQDDSFGKSSNRFGGQKRKRIGESTVIEGGYYGNPFGKDEPKKRSYGEKRNFGEGKSGGYGEKRNNGKRNFGNNNDKSFKKDNNNGEFKKRSYGEKRNFGEKKDFGGKKRYNNDDDMDLKSLLSDGEDLGFTEETSQRNFRDKTKSTRNNRQANSNFDNKKPFNRKNNTEDFEVKEVNGLVRLNRFIANAGVCSRREADKLIENGQVTVNGKTMKELGYQVKPTDEVRYMGELLSRERPVYILLNKPKDHITTTDDPEGRKTVMNLVKQVGDDVRIYPVGRLDRNTTGLLLMTNDGKLAAKLSHPSSNIKKTYYVTIDKPITEVELSKLLEGVELEDGISKFDSLEVLTSDYLNISVTLHSGKNRIVRRMFNHLGYEVEKLDRISYAGLTKKGLERGSWRHLTNAEVVRLKFLLR